MFLFDMFTYAAKQQQVGRLVNILSQKHSVLLLIYTGIKAEKQIYG